MLKLNALTSFLLLSLALLLAFTNGQLRPQVITVPNGETQGRWGDLQSCPTGYRAICYQSQHEANIPVTDDTAMNSIILTCNDPALTNISSTFG